MLVTPAAVRSVAHGAKRRPLHTPADAAAFGALSDVDAIPVAGHRPKHTKARQILRLSGFAPGAIPSDVVRVLEHANVPRHCIARVFPRLKPDLTPASRPLDFFVILNWDEKFFRFKFRDLPRPVEGEFLPTAGQDAVAPPELIANSGSIRALEAALNPDRALVGSYAGRSVRLGNIRRRLDRGTILHHLAETFGVHGIIPRLMPEGATAPLEPIVALPRVSTRQLDDSYLVRFNTFAAAFSAVRTLHQTPRAWLPSQDGHAAPADKVTAHVVW